MKALRIILATICTIAVGGLVWLLVELATFLMINFFILLVLLMIIAIGGTALVCVFYLTWQGFMNLFKSRDEK